MRAGGGVGDNLLPVLLAELRQRHVQQWKRGVRARVNRHVHLADDRVPQVRVGRLLWSFQQFLAIDDLHDAVPAGAIAEVHAIELRHRDRSMQLRRHGIHRRARLLPGQSEIANEDGVRRIAQVVDLRHARCPPRRIAADQIRNARLALPEALVRLLQVVDHSGEERRLFGNRDVPDLMPDAAQRAKQIELALVRLRQIGAAARAHHLRLTGSLRFAAARDVRNVFGLTRIGDVDHRRAVVLEFAGQHVRHRTGVMADIRDVPIALFLNDRLVGAARLHLV